MVHFPFALSGVKIKDRERHRLSVEDNMRVLHLVDKGFSVRNVIVELEKQ